MWAYSWPFVAWGVFGWAQQSSARWALESYATTADVGKYAVLSQLGYTPILTMTAFGMTFLAPIIFSRAGDASSADRNEGVRILTHTLALTGLVLTGLACVVTYIIHNYIFQILTEESYHSVSNYLPWIVLSGGIFAIAQVYATRLMALMIPKAMLVASIGSSVIGISSAFIGVHYLNLEGAVASTFIHAVSYLLLILLAVYTSPGRL
jgi:O-antigen/teichoic acid export membrane protein